MENLVSFSLPHGVDGIALLMTAILGAGFSASLAAAKHRNALGWFAIGAAMPLIAIVLAIVLPAVYRNGFGWFAIGAIYPLLGMILAIVMPENPAPPPAAGLAAATPWWRAD